MKVFQLLKNIDLSELNYSGTYLYNFKKESTISEKIREIKDNILFVFKQVFFDVFFPFGRIIVKNKKILYYNTINQKNSLEPLYNRLNNSVFISPLNSTLPMTAGWLISLFLGPYTLYIIIKNRNSKIRISSLRYNFFIYGMLVWWIIYFRYTKPTAIVFSNDHLVWHRVLNFAAKYTNIPTIYIQHASVTEKFPKLEFTLSLLEGEDALNKYSKNGVEGAIHLIGMPKFDTFFKHVNKNRTIDSIGICTNILDNEETIETLCQKIKKYYPAKKIILRPHPRDKRLSFYLKLKEKYQIKISDSQKENSFEYLKNIDLNVAGESSIHLEAVLMNVYPIYFKLGLKVIDHYGYLKNKLVTDSFNCVEDLILKINEIEKSKDDIRHRSKYYIDTINTEYDGRSIELAIKHINSILCKNQN